MENEGIVWVVFFMILVGIFCYLLGYYHGGLSIILRRNRERRAK